tara:strand:+ start:460 stop:774 length:315 start_codon:yes stop_codon:yes gene_type:complete
MDIYDKYDKIIIGITEDKPSIMSQFEIKLTLESVFKHLPKFEVILVKGIIVNSKSPKNLPKFDVCVSGNSKVIKKINEFGLMTKFLPRSEGLGYSGTEIRKLIN